MNKYGINAINMNFEPYFQEIIAQDSGRSAIWIHKEENVRYCTGFTGDSTEAVWLNQQLFLITDARYTEQAQKECPTCSVIDHHGKKLAAIVSLCEQYGVHHLYGEVDVIPLSWYQQLKSLSSILEILPADIDRCRQIKTKKEIACIRKACQIADQALTSIIPFIEKGRTENEVRIALEKAMLDYGSEKTSFDTIVASGWRGALPHGVATDKVIESNELVMIDFGAIYQGYHSDMTRTFIIGPYEEEKKRWYDAVLHAQNQALQAVTSGKICSEIDAIARRCLDKAGWGSYFTHSLGHSVGLEIHERPTFSPNDHTVLQQGMVITIEPGIYLPGQGGVRIEDTVVVTDEQPEILTGFSKEWIEI